MTVTIACEGHLHFILLCVRAQDEEERGTQANCVQYKYISTENKEKLCLFTRKVCLVDCPIQPQAMLVTSLFSRHRCDHLPFRPTYIHSTSSVMKKIFATLLLLYRTKS